MTAPVIIDAGPALNFFSTHNKRLLLSVVGGHLHAPETVIGEVRHRGESDPRFTAAPRVLTKLAGAGRLTILSDDVTPALSGATERITGVPMVQRRRRARDLGEVMVIAHAAVLADAALDVTVIIDEGDGADVADREWQRLKRQRHNDPRYGSISLARTVSVLEAAIGSTYLPDRGAMRRVYSALERCDDGLVDISRTRLLDQELWRPRPGRSERAAPPGGRGAEG